MKKSIITLASLIATFSLPANTVDKEFPGDASIYQFVKNPADVCYQGENSIILYPEFRKDETSYSLDFINEDLDIIKSIVVDKVVTNKYSTVIGPEFVFRWDYISRPNYNVNSLSIAEESVQGQYYDGYHVVDTPSGDTVFLRGALLPSAELVAYIEGGGDINAYMAEKGVCDDYAVYESASKVLTYYIKGRYYCTGETTGNTINYGRTNPVTEYHYIEGLDYINWNTHKNTGWLFATQTVFNDDADYEILYPSYTTVHTVSTQNIGIDFPDAYGGTSTIWFEATMEEYTPILSGIEVKKANSGNVVATFEFPAEYEVRGMATPYLVLLGSHRYLQVGVYTKNQGNFAFYYNIDRPSGIQSPQLIRQTDIYPTVVNRGEQIHVTMGNDGKIQDISVVGINGTIEDNIPGHNQSESLVPTSSLPAGLHVISVTDGEGNRHSQKVIVK